MSEKRELRLSQSGANERTNERALVHEFDIRSFSSCRRDSERFVQAKAESLNIHGCQFVSLSECRLSLLTFNVVIESPFDKTHLLRIILMRHRSWRVAVRNEEGGDGDSAAYDVF